MNSKKSFFFKIHNHNSFSPYVAHRQNSCALAEWKGNTTKIEMQYFINPDENAIIEWLVTFGPVNVGISVPVSLII